MGRSLPKLILIAKTIEEKIVLSKESFAVSLKV